MKYEEVELIDNATATISTILVILYQPDRPCLALLSIYFHRIACHYFSAQQSSYNLQANASQIMYHPASGLNFSFARNNFALIREKYLHAKPAD